MSAIASRAGRDHVGWDRARIIGGAERNEMILLEPDSGSIAVSASVVPGREAVFPFLTTPIEWS